MNSNSHTHALARFPNLANVKVIVNFTIILDEPTAALDAESEYTLFQRFNMLTQGVTTLLISHRFSTVRMADRILVIDEGKILEEGTHEQLMNKGGRYATLYRMQSEKYK